MPERGGYLPVLKTARSILNFQSEAGSDGIKLQILFTANLLFLNVLFIAELSFPLANLSPQVSIVCTNTSFGIQE